MNEKWKNRFNTYPILFAIRKNSLEIVKSLINYARYNKVYIRGLFL